MKKSKDETGQNRGEVPIVTDRHSHSMMPSSGKHCLLPLTACLGGAKRYEYSYSKRYVCS